MQPRLLASALLALAAAATSPALSRPGEAAPARVPRARTSLTEAAAGRVLIRRWFATWFGAGLLRRAGPVPDLHSDHMRRDIGLAPRDAASRQIDRARFGLPI